MKHRTRNPKSGAAGFSLLEVAVAAVILVIITLSFILSLVYANRSAVIASLQASAVHTLQGEIERIRADGYDLVAQSRYPDVTPAGSRKIYLDAEGRVPVSIVYDVLTTFSVVAAGSNSVTVKGVPVNLHRNGRLSEKYDGVRWSSESWAGNLLLVVSGRGFTQRACILGNQPYTALANGDVLTITTDTSGKTSRTWDIQPDTSSVVQLNMGKIVTVRVSWRFGSREFVEEMRTLVLPSSV